MDKFKGFADLKTYSDLIEKLRFDLDRLKEAPSQQTKLYAAFDFFVTAEHILDWKYPSDHKKRKELKDSEMLLEITSHLANGVKHFEATDSRHKSVRGVENLSYVEDDYVENGYFQIPIVVYLRDKPKTFVQTEAIEVVLLAERVYNYWAHDNVAPPQ